MWEKRAAEGGWPPDGICRNMLITTGASAAIRISPQRRKKRSLAGGDDFKEHKLQAGTHVKHDETNDYREEK
jgi:hypothetical protein